MGILEKIGEIEKEIARTQKNKGERLIMDTRGWWGDEDCPPHTTTTYTHHYYTCIMGVAGRLLGAWQYVNNYGVNLHVQNALKN